MIFRLDERMLFPEARLAEPDGLLAVGGDLSAARLLLAYQSSIFPWFSEDDPILWYSPHQRFVLFPEELNISKSMKAVLQSGRFSITVDRCFDKVIAACSSVKRVGQDGTWITADMVEAYTKLHYLGHAHSIEIWDNGNLAGGLYGVSVSNIFCGESMFSLVSNASKLALIHLCKSGLYKLIDCQVHTGHLESMGARFINRDEYLELLSSE